MAEQMLFKPYLETLLYISVFAYTAYSKKIVEGTASRLARFKHAHGLGSNLADALKAFRERKFKDHDIELLFGSFSSSWLVMASHSAAVTISGFCFPFTWIPSYVFILTNTLVQVAVFDLTLLPLVTELILPTIFIMPALYLINSFLYHVPRLVYDHGICILLGI